MNYLKKASLVRGWGTFGGDSEEDLTFSEFWLCEGEKWSILILGNKTPVSIDC